MVRKRNYFKYLFLAAVLMCGFVLIAGFIGIAGIMYSNWAVMQSATTEVAQIAPNVDEPLAIASGLVIEDAPAFITEVNPVTNADGERAASFAVSVQSEGETGAIADSQPNSAETQFEAGRGSFSSSNPNLELPVFSDTLPDANAELLSAAQSASLAPQSATPVVPTPDPTQDGQAAVAAAQLPAATATPVTVVEQAVQQPTAVPPTPTDPPAVVNNAPAPTIAAPQPTPPPVIERESLGDQAQQFLGSIFGRAAEPVAPTPVPTSAPAQNAAPAPVQNTHPSGLPIPQLPPAQYSEVPYLFIPRLDLYLPVGTVPIRNGVWDTGDLGDRIGLLPTIGQKPHDQYGMVIGGHVTLSATQAGPFLQLSRLEPGDIAIYRWKGVDYIYVLDRAESVDPSAVESLYVEDGKNLIVITCGTWDQNSRVFAERLLTNFRLVHEGPSQ